MRFLNRLGQVTAAALVAAGMAASAQARDLNVAVQKLPDVLEPALENSNVHLRVMYSIFETLVKTDYRDSWCAEARVWRRRGRSRARNRSSSPCAKA